MVYFTLQKKHFNDFINHLLKLNKIVAPVAKGYNNYAFEEINSGEDISLDYIPTILPPKKYLMPQHETLVEYKVDDHQKMEAIVEYEPFIIFGVHTCDIAGIQSLNLVFADKPKDLHYLFRKNKMTIIGFECNNYCDDYASCAAMGNHNPGGGFDLFMSDLGNYYLIQVQTNIGEELVENTGFLEEATAEQLNALDKLREQKRKTFKNEFGIELNKVEKLFDEKSDHPVWDEIGDKCVSCGNCTNVCPTCYCFDVVDIPNLDLKSGKRIRVWDSCQNEPFAEVAGGENFREKRKDRQRHRFYRKFKYHNDRYSRFFCTGCGRCSRTCMAEINLIDTIKRLKKGK